MNIKFFLALLFMFVIGGYLGFKTHEIYYDDICLDMGGGKNPGNHPICVISNEPSMNYPPPIERVGTA